MTRHSPLQQIKEAKQIARDHGMYVVEKAGSFILYRKTDTGSVRIGARSTPGGLRQFVCRCANFH